MMFRRRAWGRQGGGRGAIAGALVLLYLTLGYNALTCALHHGLYGECHMMGAGQAMAGMPGMSGMAGMDHGPTPRDDLAPKDGPARGGVGLCHCLDNLAAEPHTPFFAATPPPPVPEIAPVPVAVPASPPAGPAQPRAPPSHLA